MAKIEPSKSNLSQTGNPPKNRLARAPATKIFAKSIRVFASKSRRFCVNSTSFGSMLQAYQGFNKFAIYINHLRTKH